MSLATHVPFLKLLADLAATRQYEVAQLSAIDRRLHVRALNAAYRWAMEFCEWRALRQTKQVTLGTQKEVVRAVLEDGSPLGFYTLDPLPKANEPLEINYSTDARGYFLDTDLTQVWAHYRRGVPELEDWPTHADWGGASTPYVVGKVYAFSGHYYRCTVGTSTAGPSENFAWLQDVDGIERFLVEAVLTRAQGVLLGTRSGERDQQAQLYAEAEEMLNKAYRMQPPE